MTPIQKPRSTLLMLALSFALALGGGAPVAAEEKGATGPAEVAGSAPSPSLSERLERVGSIALDVGVVRALSFGQLVIGTAYFVALSPLSLPGWRLDESYENLVLTPFDYTFRRDLGRL
jgi:hypothetical protein